MSTQHRWLNKEFEERMRSHIDDIYFKTFHNLVEVKRSERDAYESKELFMDMELGIDTQLIFKNGSIITSQEKSLHYDKRNYQQFTFEYYKDQANDKKGDWFNLVSQIYFFGYANEDEDGYHQYWILDVLRLRMFLNNYNSELLNQYLRENHPPAKANFFAIPFKLINNKDVIINSKI